MVETCQHAHATRVGYADSPLINPDASVAGLSAVTTIRSCPDCRRLVATVALFRRSHLALLGTAPILLRPPVGGGTDA